MNQVELIKQKRLHKLAQSIQEKKPWEFFEDIGIFAVSLVDRQTPFYCVFLEDTIIVCPNPSALAGLVYLSEQNQMPQIQRFRYQQHLALYFEPLENVSKIDYELLLACDVEPIDQKYPIFESAMPSVLPDQLVKREIQIMIDVLKQINDSMDEIEAIMALKHDVNHEMVHRYFDFDANQWQFKIMNMILNDVSIPAFPLSQEQIASLKDAPISDQVLEVDIAYTPLKVEPKPGHRQGVVRVLVLANHQQEAIYYQKLVTLKDDGLVMLVEKLLKHFSEHGLPKQLVVRDDIMLSFLAQFVSELNIEVVKNQQLITIDTFVKELVLQSFH